MEEVDSPVPQRLSPEDGQTTEKSQSLLITKNDKMGGWTTLMADGLMISVNEG